MHAIVSIARFTFIEGLRTRLLWIGFGLLCASGAVAEFSAMLAITDSQSYRTGFYGALSRLLMVMTIALFVITSSQRELTGRLLDMTWSRPVSRATWYAGRLAGSCAVASALAAMTVLPLYWVVEGTRALAWGVSLAAELYLIAAVSLAAAVSLRQGPLAVLAVGIFYLLTRVLDAMILISRGPTVDPTAWSASLIAELVHTLAMVLPSLDRFTQAAWLYSDAEIELGFILVQSAIYIALSSAIGLFDVYRHDD